MSSTPRPTVAVAFHSGYGHTAVMAEAVVRGATRAGASVVSIAVDTITDEQWVRLDAADAIVFGAPTYSAPTCTSSRPGVTTARFVAGRAPRSSRSCSACSTTWRTLPRS